jgi:MscS family membrane protein
MNLMDNSLLNAICTVPLHNPVALLLSLLALFVATALVASIASFIVRRLERRLSHTTRYWHTTLLSASHAPLVALIVIVGLLGAARLVGHAYDDTTLVPYLSQMRHLAVIVCGGWLLLRWKSRISRLLLARQELSPATSGVTRVEFFSKMATLIIWLIVILLLLQGLGFDITALVAFGGVGGIVVGLAARDTFANLFSGIMLYFTRPFQVGDWIDSPDRQIEGYVEQIGWYMTSIRTMDKRPLYVPNALLSSIVIRNPARMSHRQIKTIFGLRYEDFSLLPGLIDAMRSYLRSHPDIDQEAPVRVHLVAYSPSSIDVQVQAHTRIIDWDGFYDIQHQLLMELGGILQAHGAQLAYPTQTLHLAPLGNA